MSEYPEHIDQIDDFYRSQLADHEIEPPAGLWDKISAHAFETPSSEAQATIRSKSTLLTTTQKLIGLGAATLLIVAGTYYWYSNKPGQTETESETIPAVEQPAEGIHDFTNSTETNTNDEQLISPTHSSTEKNNTPSSIHKTEEESSVLPEVKEETNSELQPENTVIAEPQKTRADSIADIQTTQKAAPKEKVKFKDKYKKEYQDSTRKIFVPGK
ncbi:MAG: hypothetical protein K0R51_1726 [Cytophagaceae bacterium]|jgi:hypothetical protein|nr:hypothetical protein [Cytophagaceae bacterium]